MSGLIDISGRDISFPKFPCLATVAEFAGKDLEGTSTAVSHSHAIVRKVHLVRHDIRPVPALMDVYKLANVNLSDGVNELPFFARKLFLWNFVEATEGPVCFRPLSMPEDDSHFGANECPESALHGFVAGNMSTLLQHTNVVENDSDNLLQRLRFQEMSASRKLNRNHDVKRHGVRSVHGIVKFPEIRDSATPRTFS